MQKTSSSPESTSASESPMNTLLAKLSQQQNILDRQKGELVTTSESQLGAIPKDLLMAATIPVSTHWITKLWLERVANHVPFAGQSPLTAFQIDSSSNGDNSITATPDKANTPVTEPSEACVSNVNKPDSAAFLRLQKELALTKQELARVGSELSQTQIANHTVNQALGPQSEAGYEPLSDSSDGKMQYAFNAAAKIPTSLPRQDTWPPNEETPAPASDAFPTGFNRGRSSANQTIWNNGFKPSLPYQVSAPLDQNPGYGMNAWSNAGRQPFGTGIGIGLNMNPQTTYGPIQPQQYNMSGPVDGGYRGGAQLIDDAAQYPMSRLNPPSRPTSGFGGRNNGWGGNYPYNTPIGGPRFSPPQMQSNGMYQPPPAYQAGPVGSRLSPTAAEFNIVGDNKPAWNAPSMQPDSTYVSPHEPINYRRLLDRNMNCNWDLIVNKIVHNNDQQASIFLQQKLKVGTAEQKFAIVESIIAQAYPLMINRFGNFLVQRCFEHGTQEQVIAIAQAIRGNTLQLSMDAFGCHVIQKAFDAVPEEYKAIMVHELLRRIPETVVHRYACHVWQKLFELRWSDSPPQIMKYVNEALRGMWHEVALGETGSLVVQNIFENCLEEDKRPCIEEVLASIDIISHGQFGNWCIQHICEHGASQDRTRAIDHILRYATEYSMDQYASKVIEKCLKIGGTEFLDRYLERVCEGRADRPRMPLVDIAGDQFGNYLIQYILSNSSPQHREIVASHVRKHMVSLRGSKYGSRVAMLCSNPAYTTRPGPPTGMQLNRNSSYNHSRGCGGYR
ncbi:Meiotic coiled-coil protein 2 [Neofusicoccum parvum]|uniref:Meiotic coiled-coil protein 2 n=2 Tax=Neofusicoccum parvum TaxID=310453 RepID=A0ACB5SL16_9PEZI|nr:putative pumilio-family rna binding repeat protein [Neofusicoccum parvum UCRNP2]GME44744.1 Meiotic coiled-coil protein 2 [Neofusicoccum parvum]GME59815.1 Meiotic coiled-coil protein 2 [Neofusicoccum parvum]